MKNKKYLIYIGLVFFVVLLIFIKFHFFINYNLSVCFSTKDLDEQQINELSSLGDKYLNFIKTEDDSLYSELSKNTRYSYSSEEFDSLLKSLNEAFPIESNSLIEIFNVNSKSGDRALCTNDLSNKKETYFVNVPEDYNNFVIGLYEASSVNNTKLYVSLFFVQEDSEWKLDSFNLQIKEINGKDADYFINLANQNLAEGNKRNALLLYAAGSGLLLNNGLIRSSLVDEAYSQINSLNIKDVPLTNYVTWKVNPKDSYIIYKIQAILTQKDLGLEVSYVTNTSLEDAAQLKKESKDIADYIKIEFPEYGKVFDGIIIKSVNKIPQAQESIPAYNNVYSFD